MPALSVTQVLNLDHFLKMNYWLLKSEPDVFGIDDLKRCKKQTHYWDGVRNYQARNFMRDQMQVGDLAFFYHSNATPPGIAGIVRIASGPYPDPTQFDSKSKYFDAGSDPAKPRWVVVDVEYQRHMKRFLTLDELRRQSALADMLLLRKGNRLSITPVEPVHWRAILQLENV